MLDLGLQKDRMQRLRELLVTSHRIAVTVQLLTMEHKAVGNLTPYLLGGQLTMDAQATEATRQVTLELIDPFHKLHLDSDTPDDGSLYFHRMIRVVYHVMDADGADIFHIPLFTGPLSKAERNGYVLNVTAVGKEKLSMSAVWKGKTYKKNAQKTWVIKDILGNLGGEMRMDIPNLKDKLPADLSVNREKTPWSAAQKVARSMGMQLFYDGRGICRLRKKPKNVCFEFRQKRSLLSLPQVSYDAEGAINAIQIIGGKPPKSKKKITYRMIAPRAHPLSPHKLGRWGKPRYLPEVIEDSKIRSKKEARNRCRDRLKEVLFEQVEVAFDSLVIPFLEEMDVCRVVSDEFTGKFRLTKMTIPFTADGVSSIGYIKKVRPRGTLRAIKGSRGLRRTSERKQAA